MAIVIILILLAIAFGIGGLILEGLQWLLIIAVVLLVIGLVAGRRGR